MVPLVLEDAGSLLAMSGRLGSAGAQSLDQRPALSDLHGGLVSHSDRQNSL